LGKNWLFYSEDLFHYRWEEVLTLKPPLIEIVTWNDYGESHYIGPVNRRYPGDNDGSKVYADTDMPHVAFRALAKLYIAAYKAGMTSVDVSLIQEDQVMYWYRTAPKGAIASSDPLPPPRGRDLVNDVVFVVTALKEPGQLKVTSGPTVTTVGVGAGVAITWATMGVGTQSFEVSRNGATVLQGTATKQITSSPSIYNFNVFTGVFPPTTELWAEPSGESPVGKL
jgi:glucan endo-1,3-alpha-glucosidase